MTETCLPGDPPIPLVMRKSARAQRISLRISQLDGRVTLTLPKRVAEREGLAFAREKEAWIRKHLAARDDDVLVGLGTRIPIAGLEHDIVQGQGRRVQCSGRQILVPGAPDQTGKRLKGYLKQMARDKLAQASDHYSERLGRPYSAITLRDTRSRWGSCTQTGRLMFSWRLVLAPSNVLEYVAAHEVAHLAEMNHSQRFWKEVERVYGDFSQPRAWLRREGAGLHRYRFDD